MKIEEVRGYFENNWTRAMRALKLGANSYQNWLRIGYIPIPTQLKIEKATKGALVAEVNKKG